VPAPTALVDLATGLLFGLSLIVALGAQNLYVLRQGMRREHVGLVVTICTASDVLLIVAGVAGAGLVAGRRPHILGLLRLAGAIFVIGYALLALRRAWVRPAGPATAGPPSSRASAAATCLAFTWLNPAVYLDTVVLVGSVANAVPGRQWWFGAGAALGSALWFGALGYGARLLTPLFSRPTAARWLDSFTAAVLAAVGLRLLFLA
jgi:L-lysine exporter family protein LysE/ArgO